MLAYKSAIQKIQSNKALSLNLKGNQGLGIMQQNHFGPLKLCFHYQALNNKNNNENKTLGPKV